MNMYEHKILQNCDAIRRPSQRGISGTHGATKTFWNTLHDEIMEKPVEKMEQMTKTGRTAEPMRGCWF